MIDISDSEASRFHRRMDEYFAETRPSQVDRVHEYIMTHGSITRKSAVTALDVYKLPTRIGEAEKKYNVTYVREEKHRVNRWGENMNWTVYHRPGTVLREQGCG